ncbi:hypothetical protein [uncultured Clostridium sp.]|uniref:hypothetical protein n=1 Tax=uncultured Clostridium sp. TaxID=59620 RepID=UPI0025E62AB5|nr:hypothetical protein [uncultured Clostridium sp.]
MPTVGGELSINYDVSANLVKHASGNITIWSHDGKINCVLTDTELRNVLTNNNITSINGISKEIFLEYYRNKSGNYNIEFSNWNDLDQSIVNSIFDEIKLTLSDNYCKRQKFDI